MTKVQAKSVLKQTRKWISQDNSRKAVQFLIQYLEAQEDRDRPLLHEAIILSNRLESWYSRSAFGHDVKIEEKNKITYDLLHCLSKLEDQKNEINLLELKLDKFEDLEKYYAKEEQLAAQNHVGAKFDFKLILPFGITILIAFELTNNIFYAILIGIAGTLFYKYTGFDIIDFIRRMRK